MKSITSKNRFSIKSMFLVMILMISGFFGHCMMMVNTMAMGHQMTEDSNMGGCDGVCNVEDVNKSEEFALLKTDPPEPEATIRNFVDKINEALTSGNGECLKKIDHLSYLPPGTHSEGIKLRI